LPEGLGVTVYVGWTLTFQFDMSSVCTFHADAVPVGTTS